MRKNSGNFEKICMFETNFNNLKIIVKIVIWAEKSYFNEILC